MNSLTVAISSRSCNRMSSACSVSNGPFQSGPTAARTWYVPVSESQAVTTPKSPFLRPSSMKLRVSTIAEFSCGRSECPFSHSAGSVSRQRGSSGRGVPYLAGPDRTYICFGDEQHIGCMRFSHVELHSNTALPTQKVNEHTYITALEIQIFKPCPLYSVDVTNQSNWLKFGKQLNLPRAVSPDRLLPSGAWDRQAGFPKQS